MQTILHNLTRALRYIAAPLVGLAFVWFVDADHDIVAAMTRKIPGDAKTSYESWWPLLGFLLATGVSVYYLNVALVHSSVSLAVTAWLSYQRGRKNLAPIPDRDDLDFARWARRGLPQPSHLRSIQDQLDEANAVAHFLYCTAWCLVLASFFLGKVFAEFNPPSSYPFYVVALVFFVVGAMQHVSTSKRDIKIYEISPPPTAAPSQHPPTVPAPSQAGAG